MAQVDPIAVIGLSFKFPQGADSEESFWSMLMEGRCASTEFPKDRLDISSSYHPDGNREGSIAARGGHFLQESISAFDAPFFSISSSEAAGMDPQHRGLLETTYRALENAGLPVEHVSGSKTAVYTGCFTNDWKDLYSKDPEYRLSHAITGLMPSIFANRLSWFFNFKGPSANIDTACSSSLVALDLACKGLANKDINMAVVAASNLILAPDMMHLLESMNMISPDGKCFSFDHRANGYARGEGFAAIIVKRLSDAIKDGDTIRAIIRNTGTNQDGYTSGITKPNMDSQEMLIRETYAKAGLPTQDTMYFEAHGTGTEAGDPCEAIALGKVFRDDRLPQSPLVIGAVKSNIGHLEGASGLAGLIKTILTLERGIIPPNSNFEKVNPRIDTKYFKLKFPQKPISWPVDGLRRASLNSFGFGGSNAHVIIDDALHYLEERRLIANHNTVRYPPILKDLGKETCISDAVSSSLPNGNKTQVARPKLLVFSASSSDGVDRLASTFAQNFATKDVERYGDDVLNNLAYTLDTRRSMLKWKSFVVSSSPSDLKLLEKEISTPVLSTDSPSLAFILTGQGAQWARMGVELLNEYPVFGNTLKKAERFLENLGCEWSLLDELLKGKEESNINLPAYSQPICTAIQIALIDLFRSFNIFPAAVVGHSSGEIAAAYCLGAISLGSAMNIAYHRGALASTLKAASIAGGMISVGLAASQVQVFIEKIANDFGHRGLVVGCVNSPNNVTVSGDSDQIDALKSITTAKGIFATKLQVDVAYHSPHMDFIAGKYRALIGDLQSYNSFSGTPRPIMISSLTGKVVGVKELQLADYWVENMTSPVRFSEAVETLCAHSGRIPRKIDGSHRQLVSVQTLLEIGPHSALRGPIRDILRSMKRSVNYDSALMRHSSATSTVLSAVGRLYCTGFQVKLEAVNRPEPKTKVAVLVDLPEYPFDHSQEYWDESRITKGFRLQSHARLDLLGKRVADWNPLDARWRNFIKETEMPWVNDHKINGSTLYPAGGMLVMAIEAANQVADHERQITGFQIQDAKFQNALIIPQTPKGIETEFHLQPLENTLNNNEKWYKFKLYAFQNDQAMEICNGLVSSEYHSDQSTEVDGGKEALEDLIYHQKAHQEATLNCERQISDSDFYAKMRDNGFGFGPSFQPLTDISYGVNRAVATIKVFRWPSSQFPQPHIIHPTTMDGILHLSLASLSQGGSKSIPTMVPTVLRRLWVSNVGLSYPDENSLSALTASSVSKFKRETQLSVIVMDESRRLLRAKVEGLQMSVVANSAMNEEDLLEKQKQLCHFISWKPDVGLLDQDQISRICSTGKPSQPEPFDFIRDLQLVASTYLVDALDRVSRSNLPSPPHFQKYLSWAQQVGEKILKGDLPRISIDSQQFVSLTSRVENYSAEGKLYVTVGKNLVPILTRQIDALELLFSSDLLSNLYRELNDTIFQKFGKYLDLLVYKEPCLNFLEIGAGTGGTTLSMMKILASSDHATIPRYAQYDYTDISSSFFMKAQEIFKDQKGMNFKTLNIENDPTEQDFAAESYDVIVAANVLHATHSMKRTLKHVRKLLKPGGKLFLFEIEPKHLRVAFVMGLLPGWWLGEEEYRASNPCLTTDEWNLLLLEQGFSGIDLKLRDFEDEECHEMSVFVSTAVARKPEIHRQIYSNGSQEAFQENGRDELERVLFVADCQSRAQVAIMQQLESVIGICGGLSSEMVSLKQAAAVHDMTKATFVFLQELERPLLGQIKADEFTSLTKIIGSTTNVVWMSRGSGERPQDAEYSIIDGFARCARAENRDLVLTTIAFEMQETELTDSQLRNFGQVFRSMGARNTEKTYEPAFKESQELLNIGRVVEANRLTEQIHARSLRKQANVQRVDQSPPLKLAIQQPGLLNTLRFIEDSVYDTPLEADEVEIKVHAVGMNFKDCLIALNQIGDATMGFECAGVVSRTSNLSKDSFSVGDRVCMITPDTFKSYVRATSPYVCRIPDDMGLSEAASIPVTFITCWACINDIAKLQPRESILIHSGAGGTGQAAIQIAQIFGADIFVTVGSEAKKKLIMDEYGIPEDHIFYSRDTSFAKGIKRVTQNLGVDVVLNSLSGEGLLASWELVKPYGRFVEIGKRDIHSNSSLPMEQFAKSVTFSAFDGSIWMGDHPGSIAQHLKTLMGLFSQGKLHVAHPLHIQPISKIEDTFRFMQDGDHIGKVVVEIKGEYQVPTVLETKPSFEFTAGSTFLIAGGLGGLGRSTAEWMVSRGARNLILLSRAGPRKKSQIAWLNRLRAKGAHIEAPACDITDGPALESALQVLAVGMPPIRGCIQSTMVLNDALISNMAHENWNNSIRPKVEGSWNLHNLLPKDMDFFILLSSISGIVGFRGQANYAAGNTYMDALASRRTMSGEKTVSIDLGVMKSDGFLANNKALLDRLVSAGDFRAVSRAEYYALLDYYCDPRLGKLEPSECQVMIGLQPNSHEDSLWAGSPLASLLRQNSQDADVSGTASADKDGQEIKQLLKNASTSSEAVNVVSNAIVQKLSKTLSTLSRVDMTRPTHTYGVDSLLAIELRNWILKIFEADVPIFEILGGSTFLSMANKVVEKSYYKPV